ncbi:ChbG/HpnK family deacetylase [Vibrio sp. ZSDE26]|uniref:ChbG/HpnK family deacetylase n=1 Tax=Vibrio amylolyticus TaxID=2847292 RepID=A0A9X1XLN3_9VIBR|nr:ChbG/HpnK family deacetylase [Vibrio amylolyticus]MCK6264480.1 ChbG/HpnK family deacetylase [Vibrio amylolyticus]
MQLIINADDFGLTAGINSAIVEAMQSGLVTSTTLMVNQEGTDDAIELMHQHELENIGLHVNITSGKAVSDPKDIPDLVDENGRFLGRSHLVLECESIPSSQVYLEAMNQYKAAISKGVKLAHVDSHHFAAFLPNLINGFVQFANEVGLPTRRPDYYDQDLTTLNVPTTDQFSSHFYAGRATEAGFKQTILELKEIAPNGTAEIMAHPAYYDSELDAVSSYTAQRELELNVLLSPTLREWLDSQGVGLISFNDITRNHNEEY